MWKTFKYVVTMAWAAYFGIMVWGTETTDHTGDNREFGFYEMVMEYPTFIAERIPYGYLLAF